LNEADFPPVADDSRALLSARALRCWSAPGDQASRGSPGRTCRLSRGAGEGHASTWSSVQRGCRAAKRRRRSQLHLAEPRQSSCDARGGRASGCAGNSAARLVAGTARWVAGRSTRWFVEAQAAW